MNWTGGKLQQHSKRGKSSVVQRQKEHFARARARLQGGRQENRSPFEPSFLNEHHQSPLRQTRLDDFRNTAPLARRLEKLGSVRGLQRLRGQSGSKSIDGPQSGDISKICLKSPKRTQTARHGHFHQQRRRKLMPSPAIGSTTKHLQSVPEEETLENAKRRLLMQSDWVGVRISEPLKIDFSSTQERQQFGRRHKIEKKPARAFEEQDYRLRVPSIRSDLEIPARFHQPSNSQDYIRIGIGDDAFTSNRSTLEPDGARSHDAMYQPRSTRSSYLFEDVDILNAQNVDGDGFGSCRRVQQGTPDLLDNDSFQDFSDSSSHLRDRLSKPDTRLSDPEMRHENYLYQIRRDSLSRARSQEDDPKGGRLIFASSDPATAPDPEAQSHVAVASTDDFTTLDVEAHASPIRKHKAVIASDNDRLWRNYLHVASMASNAETNDADTIDCAQSEPQPHSEEPRASNSPPKAASEKDKAHRSFADVGMYPHTNMPSVCPEPQATLKPPAPPQTLAKPLEAHKSPAHFGKSSRDTNNPTLLPEPQPTFKSPAPPKPPAKSQTTLEADPDAIWKAFVFGDISPTRASASPTTVANPSPSRAHSSLQARASVSKATSDDSSILDYAPESDFVNTPSGSPDVIEDVLTTAAVASSTPSSPTVTLGAAKTPYLPPLPMDDVSSPDPLTFDENRPLRRILFSPPKKFNTGRVEADDISVDTGRDVVRLGQGRTSKRRRRNEALDEIMDDE